jgi:mandelate racemase
VIADGGDFLSFARVGMSSRPTRSGLARLHRHRHAVRHRGEPRLPRRQVVVATGDGAFGFNAMEIDTAVRHKAPVLIVVANNGAWQIEVHDQTTPTARWSARAAVRRHAAMARAFGLHAERVERTEDLAPAIARALANRPALLDVVVSPEARSSDGKSGWPGCPTCSRSPRGTTRNANGVTARRRRPAFASRPHAAPFGTDWGIDMEQKQGKAHQLTLESVQARAVSVPLRRPIVAKVGEYPQWPFILIDVRTREGVTGRGYLEPYVAKAVGPIIGVIENVAQMFQGKPLAPLDVYGEAMKTLHLNGREGMTLIALSGLDMAIWDALARAAGLPLATLLGGSPGPVRAYNTNGLWLIPKDKARRRGKSLVEEGGFKAIKMRLGRTTLQEDIEAIRIVRDAVGEDVHLMTDFNQGMTFGEALQRMHGLDDQGLYWFEEPIVYDNIEGCAQITREMKTPIQIGENIYGPREFHKAVTARRGRPLHAGPDAHRRRHRLDAFRSDRRRRRPAALEPPVHADIRATAARQRIGRLAGVERLGRAFLAEPFPAKTATPPCPTCRATASPGTRRR